MITDRMAMLKRFSVRGYRAVGKAVTLDNLSPRVVIYGDNAVGKSSILLAVRLFVRLTEHAPEHFNGPGLPWDVQNFHEVFEEDRWMFHHGSSEIHLSGAWTDGLRVALALRLDGPKLVISYEEIRDVERDHLVELNANLTPLREYSQELVELSQSLRTVQDEVARRNIQDEIETYTTLLERAVARCRDATRRRVTHVRSPIIPVPDADRVRFLSARSSSSPKLRMAARRLMAEFPKLFPALGAGTIEPLGDNPAHPQDVAWERPDGTNVALDRLGGGAQSVFGTLAALVVGEGEIACVEEPEAFVGQEAFDGLNGALRAAIELGLCEQLFLATHAVSLAEGPSIFILEGTADGVGPTIRAATGPDLTRFTAEAAPAQGSTLGRMANDGSVRLPKTVRDTLGLRPGDFVHYILDTEGRARIVTAEEYDRVVGAQE